MNAVLSLKGVMFIVKAKLWSEHLSTHFREFEDKRKYRNKTL